MTAKKTEPARPTVAAFIHLPRPTDDRMRLLKDALVYLKHELAESLEAVDDRHSTVEDWLNPAEVFTELSKLVFDIEQAKLRGAVVWELDDFGDPLPDDAPEPTTVFGLPYLGVLDVDAPAAQKKPTRAKAEQARHRQTEAKKRREVTAHRQVKKTAKRFDFAALPPAVECGC